MIVGNIVLHDGRPRIITAIQAHGAADPHTGRGRVALVTVTDFADAPEPRVPQSYLTAPTSDDLPLLPACPIHGQPGRMTGAEGWTCAADMPWTHAAFRATPGEWQAAMAADDADPAARPL